MTMEEDEFAFFKVDAAAGDCPPRSIGGTFNVAGEPLGGRFFLVIEQLDILRLADKQGDRLFNERYVHGVHAYRRIVREGNLNRLGKVGLSPACRAAGGIFAVFHLKSGTGKVHSAVGHHADGDCLVFLVDGAFHAFQDKVFHERFVVADAQLITHDQVSVGNTQGAVTGEIHMVAHFHIGGSPFRDTKLGDFHVAFLDKIHRDLHLRQPFLGADEAFILTVQFKFLQQAGTTDVHALGMLEFVTGCESADYADCTEYANNSFHNM